MAEGLKHGKCPFGIMEICGPACEIYDKKEKLCPLVIIAKALLKLTKVK